MHIRSSVSLAPRLLSAAAMLMTIPVVTLEGIWPKTSARRPLYIPSARSETSRSLCVFHPVLFKTINFNPCYIKLFVFATFLMTPPGDDSILWTHFFREPPTDCIRVEWLLSKWWAQESLIFTEGHPSGFFKLRTDKALLSGGCDSWWEIATPKSQSATVAAH